MLKKTVAVILAALMIFPFSFLTAFAQEDDGYDLGFAVATDLHYVHPLEDADARWSDTASMTFNSSKSMQNESGFIIDEFLRQCAENDECEFVFVCGDLVTYGRDRVGDHQEIAAKFREFEKNTGKQIFVINGNHDNGVGSQTDSAKFREIYREFGYDTAFSSDETCCSYATQLNDKYILIALDSFDEQYMLANGVDSGRLKWVREQAEYAREHGKYPIMITHHNIVEHQPLEAILSDKYIVSFPKTVATLFADWGIKLVFSGHTHINDVASFTTPTGNVIYDFCNASLNAYPMSYKTFKLTEDKISYETKSVESIDFEALTSVIKTGYDESELELLENDFSRFAKEYNCANALSFVKDGITPELIGIDSDSVIYPQAKKLTEALGTLLGKPLYGNDSLKSEAEKYSISIPNTDYCDMYEIICEVYCGVVSGECDYEFDDPEIQIILSAVETAAHMSMPASYAAAEYLVLSVAGPFLYEYINSTDGLDNISGELDGYGTSASRAGNIISRIKIAAERIATYFEITFSMLKKSISCVF